MLCLIQQEFKKMKREKKLLPGLLCLIIIECFANYIIYKTCTNNSIESALGKFGLNFYFFCGIQEIFGVISSMYINYFLLTQEYMYDTWDLIITKIFDKFKICISKYTVFLAYQIVFNIMSIIFYTFVTILILHQSINIKILVSMAVIILTIHLFDATVQFCIQLETGSFTLAIVGGLLYQVLKLRIPENIPIIKYTPLISETYIFNSNSFFNTAILVVCCVVSLLSCFLLVSLLSRKFYS